MNELENAGSAFPLPSSYLPPKHVLPQLSVTEAVRHPLASTQIHVMILSPLFVPPQNSQSEEEEDVFGLQRRRSSLGLSGCPLPEEEPGPGGPLTQPLRRIISIEEDPLPQLLGGGFQQPLSKCLEEEEASGQGVDRQSGPAQPLELTPTSPRGQPVGKEALSEVRMFPRWLVGHPVPCPSIVAQEPRAARGSDAASLTTCRVCVLWVPPSPSIVRIMAKTWGPGDAPLTTSVAGPTPYPMCSFLSQI